MTHPPDDSLDVLFFSVRPMEPVARGFQVHGPQMAAALARSGLGVGIACMSEKADEAQSSQCRRRRRSNEAGSPRRLLWPTPDESHRREASRALGGAAGWARRRLTRYFAGDLDALAGVVSLVETHRPGVVVALGLDGAALLRALRLRSNVARLWHAADDQLVFQLSCVRREPVSAWPARLRRAALEGLAERAFVAGADGVIAASDFDRRALQRITGARHAVTIPNGVDVERFKPLSSPPAHVSTAEVRPAVCDDQPVDELDSAEAPAPRPHSIVFWGNLSFEPNADAVRWFARDVWPRLRGGAPDARWRIVGDLSEAPADLRSLDQTPGVTLVGRVADLRAEAHRSAAVVLPLRCGRGIKNKLLEAAALGRPIVASPRAVSGLSVNRRGQQALICRTPEQWVSNIRRLWADEPYRRQLGRNARQWILERHTWDHAAQAWRDWVDRIRPAALDRTARKDERDDASSTPTSSHRFPQPEDIPPNPDAARTSHLTTPGTIRSPGRSDACSNPGARVVAARRHAA